MSAAAETRDRIRVMLVDDHEVVRLGLAELLARCGRIEVVGEAGSVAAAIDEAARLAPDLILMDLRLPDGTGIEACREILSAAPAIRVLFLTSFSDKEAATATLLAGAMGYLLKDIGSGALVRAVEATMDGHAILDARVTRAVLQNIGERKEHGEGPDRLSPQERRVLDLVVEGKTNREIGAALTLSEKTVKNYLSNAFQKLQVGRRAHAADLIRRRREEL